MTDFNRLTRKGFIERFGLLFEHSPWIVAQAETMRPFKDLLALHAGLMKVVAHAGPEAQLALLRAHPKLADKTQVKAGLTKESASEQASVGLNALTEAEFARFHELNTAYEARFGFPFIICVRLAGGKADILAAMESRLGNDPQTEFSTALAEVDKIVWLRLKDVEGA